ncbi:MAG: ferredoxin--nitrite reductase [Actinomycetota bacterium]|nr:ferredoxin--nitrite reductase [Actinomycetota bacterium]
MEFLNPTRRSGELNQVEQWKLARHPLEVAEAVRTRYAKAGAATIAEVPGEAERLKWVGIYPQRQGGDAFMLRVKVPGGRLTAAQAVTIGELAERYARAPEPHPVWGDGYCDLTTRQDVQMHWIRIGDVPAIWDALEAVGLTSVQACGDSARNVLSCPVGGVDADELFDAGPVAEAISGFFTGNREYANLPRKFKLSVTGCLDDCAQAEINDVGMLPARLEDGTVGFDLLVGGGLSDGPRMASQIDVFVGLDEAVECTRAIAQLFGELGNRENRGFSRMRYLVEELGPEQFRSELAKRAGFELRPAGEPLTRRYRGDHVGVHAEHEPGRWYVGCSVTVGRLSGADLAEAGRLAARYGDGGVRLATDQNLVLTGVPDGRLDGLLAEPLLARHSPFPGPFSRGVVACTGSEFCRFAVVETKLRAVDWARRLDDRFAGALGGQAGTRQRAEPSVVRMHFSGCSASCAQPQIADIGFRGDTAHVGDRIVEAVDVSLGGSLGEDAAFGDWLVGALPVDDVPAALGALVDRFVAGRRPDEPLHTWARRHPTTELRTLLDDGNDAPGAIPDGTGGAGE